MATLIETLDTLYTSTWQHMRDEIRDNVFDASPFWFWLRDKGKLKSVEGGRWISEPIAFDKNDQIVWLGKGGTTSLADYEFLTIAKYDWKYLACPIVRFGVDDQQNRGKMQIINLLEAKMENTRNALITFTLRNEAQYAGDSSPCNCTAPIPETSMISPTFSRSSFTNTPTGITNGPSCEMISRACSGGI